MDYFRRSTLEDNHQKLSSCRPIAELEPWIQELPTLRCKTELHELPFSSLPLSILSIFHSMQLMRPNKKALEERISIIFNERDYIKKKGASTYSQFPKRNHLYLRASLASKTSSVAQALTLSVPRNRIYPR
jgi:hypothetical protein